MTAYAKYDGEEITVWFTSTHYKADYGVPGSPTFDEFEDIEIDKVEILGVMIEQPADLPENLFNALHGLSSEVEFEVDDE